MTNRYNLISSSIVSFLANTVTFIKTTLCIYTGFFIFSCATSKKTEIVNVKIISLQGYTFKGYKYYVIYNNKFDSIYYKDDRLKVNSYYPFTIKK